jgi:hypothetical protein
VTTLRAQKFVPHPSMAHTLRRGQRVYPSLPSESVHTRHDACLGQHRVWSTLSHPSAPHADDVDRVYGPSDGSLVGRAVDGGGQLRVTLVLVRVAPRHSPGSAAPRPSIIRSTATWGLVPSAPIRVRGHRAHLHVLRPQYTPVAGCAQRRRRRQDRLVLGRQGIFNNENNEPMPASDIGAGGVARLQQGFH